MPQFVDRIPESRDELKRNELPICQYDIRGIAQIWGEEVAEIARYSAQRVRRQGGVNPQAVESIIPEGRDGMLHEHELFRCIGNLLVWWEHTDKSGS